MKGAEPTSEKKRGTNSFRKKDRDNRSCLKRGNYVVSGREALTVVEVLRGKVGSRKVSRGEDGEKLRLVG